MMFFMEKPMSSPHYGDNEIVLGKHLPRESPLGDKGAHPGLGQVLQ